MKTVFVLQHEYEQWGRDHVFFIGVYPTKEAAEEAVERSKVLPGFRDWPDGFAIDEYALGEDHWTSGFTTVVPILVKVLDADSEAWETVHAAWQPGDHYRIIDQGVEGSEKWQFSPGQVVRCEEKKIDGADGCLVAVGLIDESA